MPSFMVASATSFEPRLKPWICSMMDDAVGAALWVGIR
jgi:hypothetical protein